MIKQLENNKMEISKGIRSLFQLSYAVEAKLLEITDFPPLNRPVEHFLESENLFFGYIENNILAGVVEVAYGRECTDINSLVVHPTYFRRGIARGLLEFIFNRFDSNLFTVETGVKNTPAINLYKKLDFKEIKQWDTDFGVRKILFERRVPNDQT